MDENRKRRIGWLQLSKGERHEEEEREVVTMKLWEKRIDLAIQVPVVAMKSVDPVVSIFVFIVGMENKLAMPMKDDIRPDIINI